MRCFSAPPNRRDTPPQCACALVACSAGFFALLVLTSRVHTAKEAPCRGLGPHDVSKTHRPTSPAHLDCCLVHVEKIQCYVTGERRRPRRHDRGHIAQYYLYPGLVATFRCVPHRFSLKVGGMGARFGAFGRHRPPSHTRACGPPECVRACCALVHIISTTNRTGATTPGRRRTSKSGRRASETGCFGHMGNF